MQVKLEFGARQLTREFAENITIGELLADTIVRTRLSLPENVVAVVDGRTLDPNETLNEGDSVTFEKQAASKA